MIPSLLRSAALAAILLAAAPPGRAGADTLLQTLEARGGAATFLALVARTDLAGALAGEGSFTLFVPADAAFAAIPESTLDLLSSSENLDRLTSLLSFHVVQGEVRMADLDHDQPLSTVDGYDLSVSMEDGAPEIGGAAVTAPGIAASNGLIHMIDGLLVPPGGI